MIRHWTTLAALVEELRPQLADAIVEHCYRTANGEIGICIETPHATMQFVHALEQPVQSVYVLRANPPHQRHRIFHQISSSPLENISIIPSERIISFVLGRWELVVVAIPGAKSNCILLERETQIVLDTAKSDPTVQRSMQWQPPPQHLLNPLVCPENMTILEVLRTSTLLLAEPYSMAWCQMHQKDCNRRWGEISSNERCSIIDAAQVFRDQLVRTPHPVLARSPGGQELFLLGCVPEHWQWETVSSVEEGVRRRVQTLYRTWAFERAKHRTVRHLQTELGRLERACVALKEDVKRSEAAELLEQWGNLLVLHPDRNRRGLDTLECTDWDGATYRVQLDPTRSVLENAERYFTEARKLRRARAIAEQRLPHLEERREHLQNALQAAIVATSLSQIEAINNACLPPTEQTSERTVRSLPSGRYRRFSLLQGYVLLVGKDARSNDELTFHAAKPHDVWLHARGVEGAHGIIPLSSRQLPPHSVIEQAAAIVAYYSAARGSRYVPVSWTQRKYLRKPKKSGAGVVDLLREWVVFVEPLNPFLRSEAES